MVRGPEVGESIKCTGKCQVFLQVETPGTHREWSEARPDESCSVQGAMGGTREF